jgi:RNA polymerase sigma-70 factor (ECF subfamily)
MTSYEAETAISKARAGDRVAFQSLVEQHSRDVFRLAFRITRNEMDAEDAVQETFLKAYQKLGGFDGRSSFGTWLYRITANTSIDVLRRRRREEGRSDSLDDETAAPSRRLATDDPSPDRLLFSTEVKSRLGAALDELTEMERAAFAMRHFENFPLAEISQILGLKESATKQAVFRAVKKVRRTLEPVMRTTS